MSDDKMLKRMLEIIEETERSNPNSINNDEYIFGFPIVSNTDVPPAIEDFINSIEEDEI